MFLPGWTGLPATWRLGGRRRRRPGGSRPEAPAPVARWSGASQRRSLKCSSEQMVAMAAENASAMAPLRMTREGAGSGRRFLYTTRSGTARPVTVASVISQRRYSAMSQVQPSRCASAHRAVPELIRSSLTAVKSGRSHLPGFSRRNASGPSFPGRVDPGPGWRRQIPGSGRQADGWLGSNVRRPRKAAANPHTGTDDLCADAQPRVLRTVHAGSAVRDHGRRRCSAPARFL
jgi:hypothetical protein